MKQLTRKQWLFIAVALLLFAALKIALISWYLQRPKAAPAIVNVSCSALQQGCTLPDGSVLRFASAPHHGQPFDISLSKHGDGVPQASFSMVDMDMGFNRYHFVDGGQLWRARVTLPACVSGSVNWQLELQQGEHIYRIPFHTA